MQGLWPWGNGDNASLQAGEDPALPVLCGAKRSLQGLAMAKKYSLLVINWDSSQS
jgi:hypothetical protein